MSDQTESTIQPELISLRSKLSGEIDRDEKQAELIAKRIEKNKALLHAVNGSLGLLVAQATGYGALTDNIRAVIKTLNANFTAPDVEMSFRTMFPTAPMNKSAIRTALWNLMKKGEIRAVRTGNNRTPALYERAAAGGGSPSAGVPRKRIRPDAWRQSSPHDLIPTNGEHPK